jgi:uncharacterized repeat protein (TIGR01451 family)
LIKSEHAKIQLYDAAGNLVYDFFIDYAESADGDKGRTVTGITNPGVLGPDGAFTVGPDLAGVTSATSIFWNFNNNQAPFEFVDSPQRIPTNTYDSGTTANPANVWIYETVYEWSVPKTAFAAGGGYDSIVISEVHNSPFKTGNPVPIPVLTVSKTSDPISGSDVVGGQTILYTVTVSNPGTVRLTNVVITDAIDSNLTNINPLDGGTFDESVITWPTIPVFGADATVMVRFEADVKFGLDIAPPTAIFNTGTISPPDLSTDVQTNTTVHFVNGNPSIILSKVVDQDVFSAPGTATYTYTVTNTGNVTLTGVTLVDDQEGAINPGATTLAPGQSTTGSSIHSVSQADMDGGDLVNIAVATGTPPVGDNVSDDDTQTVTTPDSSSIKVVKTAQALAGAEGDVVTYDYTVTNTGNGPLDPVTQGDGV